ncbi:hypothetical protein JKA74_06985 [Marivirga sp. S37H4]|uniref:Uncharacterized protein n=1 Tax=Marivirga aurantiaca TaxID=2802615 RepID=A0A935C780_9BACT|nr:hypothetical protein [Marivirga aurantiaca]MBK6264775.1 hypothetical protein [Marivirga aurantiaca]
MAWSNLKKISTLSILSKEAGQSRENQAFDKCHELVDSWKRIDNHLGEAGELVRKNSDALKQVDEAIKEGLDATDAIEDAAQTLGKTPPMAHACRVCHFDFKKYD